MFEYRGWWFPDGENHFPMMLDKGLLKSGLAEYQPTPRNRSLQYIKNKRVAIDIGANVGLWSKPLAAVFDQVYAFEPVKIFVDCLKKNILKNTKIFEVALGNEVSNIDMIITEENMGQTHVNFNTKGKGSIPMTMLDAYNFTDVDYIKVDCEGFEYPILMGAKNTIITNKPVIVVEQKPHPHFANQWKQTEAINYLISLGMKQVDRYNDDYIMSF